MKQFIFAGFYVIDKLRHRIRRVIGFNKNASRPFRVQEALAGAERIELPSTVLETAILPLNYAPKLFAGLPL